MRRTYGWVVALSLAVAFQGHAADAPPTRTLPIPPEYQHDIEYATLAGRMLYRNDEASAVATDVLAARKLFPAHPHATGWLTKAQEADGSAWLVVFTETIDGTARAFADVAVAFDDQHGARVVGVDTTPRSLDGIEQRLAKVRDKANGMPGLRCTPRYNQAVWLLDDHDQHRDLVILDIMPARTERDVYPVGGFHEWRMEDADDKAPEHLAQTTTCLNMTPSPGVSALVVSHVTTRTPTLFHAFMSLSYHMPLYVLTTQNHLLWRVDHGTIERLDPSHGIAHDAVKVLSD